MDKRTQLQLAAGWRPGVAGAVMTVLIGVFFLPSPFGQGLAGLSFDLPFRLRPNRPAEGVMIIYMDEPSARKLNQPWEQAAWSRGLHANLLDRLTDCQAKAVVLDLLFDRTNAVDEVFLNAIQRANRAGLNVIVGGQAEVSGSGRYAMTNEVAPFPALENATAWGLAEWESGTAMHRRHYSGTDRTPSLAWRAAELTLKPPPRDRFAERWINFHGPPGFLPKCGYAQALDPNLTAAATFSNKVCFVGAWPNTPFASGVRADLWSTPYTRWGGGQSPGVELTATVYLNLADGHWLRRLPAWSELGLIVLAGSLFGFGLPLARPTTAAGLGGVAAIAVSAAACWGVWQLHTWFSWIIVAGIQIPIAVGWSVLAYAKRVTRENEFLEEQLASVRPSVGDAAAETPDAAGPAPAPGSSRTAPTVANPDGSGAPVGDRMPVIPDHTLLQSVGKGAYGEVWLARNAIGSYHAVKIIRRENFEGSEPFEREFRGLKKFMPISRSHPGLVLILHVGRHDRDGFIYYIMEPADDETTGAHINPISYTPKNLAKLIRQRGHLSAAECRQLGLDLAAALDYLHGQKLIHRDIKPANIIFVKGVPKFADIGLVTDIARTGQAVTQIGTVGYIAPEGPGTPAADVYSLGKVLYEAGTGLGCRLFPELPDTLVQRPDHDAFLRLNTVLLKACRQDPAQRYSTAAELRDDLLRLQTNSTAKQLPTAAAGRERHGSGGRDERAGADPNKR